MGVWGGGGGGAHHVCLPGVDVSEGTGERSLAPALPWRRALILPTTASPAGREVPVTACPPRFGSGFELNQFNVPCQFRDQDGGGRGPKSQEVG